MSVRSVVMNCVNKQIVFSWKYFTAIFNRVKEFLLLRKHTFKMIYLIEYLISTVHISKCQSEIQHIPSPGIFYTLPFCTCVYFNFLAINIFDNYITYVINWIEPIAFTIAVSLDAIILTKYFNSPI